VTVVINEGGMGEVYRAIDSKLRYHVALSTGDGVVYRAARRLEVIYT